MTSLITPTLDTTAQLLTDESLTIAGRTFKSRLMTGTGKYRNFAEMQASITASQCNIVTVA
ncbi:MAG: hypothetical protein AAGF24_16255, partial [Cyanobacteria bacterium P01_H01_bin.121]